MLSMLPQLPYGGRLNATLRDFGAIVIGQAIICSVLLYCPITAAASHTGIVVVDKTLHWPQRLWSDIAPPDRTPWKLNWSPSVSSA